MDDTLHFRALGFLLLPRAFDARALRDELDRALDEGCAASIETENTRVRYVPMMCARTPLSLALLDRFEALAATLLGGPVVPLRAKGMRYQGSTAWHRDSVLDLPSVGFAAYLEPLRGDTGALRVMPGSHRAPAGAAPAAAPDAGIAISTDPGDVIVFDEHLFHASTGGTTRRQWRVDYFLRPRSQEEETRARQYVANVFPVDWDGGYDVDRFPSYGEDWLRSGRPAAEQLRRLGVYELARAQEGFTRSRRNRSAGRT